MNPFCYYFLKCKTQIKFIRKDNDYLLHSNLWFLENPFGKTLGKIERIVTHSVVYRK